MWPLCAILNGQPKHICCFLTQVNPYNFDMHLMHQIQERSQQLYDNLSLTKACSLPRYCGEYESVRDRASLPDTDKRLLFICQSMSNIPTKRWIPCGVEFFWSMDAS